MHLRRTTVTTDAEVAQNKTPGIDDRDCMQPGHVAIYLKSCVMPFPICATRRSTYFLSSTWQEYHGLPHPRSIPDTLTPISKSSRDKHSSENTRRHLLGVHDFCSQNFTSEGTCFKQLFPGRMTSQHDIETKKNEWLVNFRPTEQVVVHMRRA